MELKMIYGLMVVVALYSTYKLLTRPNKEFQEEIEKVINSEEGKVKSQFD